MTCEHERYKSIRYGQTLKEDKDYDRGDSKLEAYDGACGQSNALTDFAHTRG